MSKQSAYSFISEMMRTPFWQMEPGAFEWYRTILLQNRGKKDGEEIENMEEKQQPYALVFREGAAEPEERLYMGNARYYRNYNEEEAVTDQLIHVTPIEGAITRNGGFCTYGTAELADAFVYGDAHPKVVGHLVILDTPGGAASANELNDVFANAKKPVVALIRGMNASKGVHIASFIPHVYAESESIEVGCIGTMCSFSGRKSGSEIDGRIFYEVYSSKSPDKNGWFREAIQHNNTKPLVEELDRLTDTFTADVKRRWPSVKDERLTGHMYHAGEVVGELVDGILSYAQAVDKVFELAGVQRLHQGVLTPVGFVPGTNNAVEPEKTSAAARKPLGTLTGIRSKVPGDPSQWGSPNPGGFIVEQLQPTNNAPAATEVTAQENNTHPQTRTINMTLEQLQGILSAEVIAGLNLQVDEQGHVIHSAELGTALADAAAAATQAVATERQAVTQLNQALSIKEAQINELAEATGRQLPKGAHQGNNAGEGPTEIEGSIFRPGMNWNQKLETLSAFASAGGIEPKKPN